jgi:hypothetical protein
MNSLPYRLKFSEYWSISRHMSIKNELVQNLTILSKMKNKAKILETL